MDLEDSFKKNASLSKMSLDEAQTMLASDIDHLTVKRLVNEADFDLDGEISWQEYAEFIRLVQKEYSLKHADSLI